MQIGMARKIVMPNAENCTKEELETSAKAAASQRSHDRMMAINALLLGTDSAAVSAIFYVDERTLRRWVAAFNLRGIDGLIEKKHTGRNRKIPQEKSSELETLVEQPSRAGQTHWTARKFHGYLSHEMGIEVSYSTLTRWLHDKGFRLKVPRSWPVKQDEDSRAAHVDAVCRLMSDPDVELWYLDESGIEGDPRPRRRWAKKGSKPTVGHEGGHLRANVCGCVCPRTGEFYALEFSHMDTEVFQAFLDNANADVKLERKKNVLILDNATWHKSKSLKFGAFEPMYLPPYSPDLNPIERLWLVMKANWFTDFVAKDFETLIERVDAALCWLMERIIDNRKTCAIGQNF